MKLLAQARAANCADGIQKYYITFESEVYAWLAAMAIMAGDDQNVPCTILWHNTLDVAFGGKDIQYCLLA